MPATEAFESYWKSIWKNSKQYSKNTQWICTEDDRKKEIEQEKWPTVANQNITKSLTNTSNWNIPGIERGSNFCLKHFASTHEHLAAASILKINETELAQTG